MMKLFQRFLANFNGLHYPQEYLCFAKEFFDRPLFVYLLSNRQVIRDITNEHLFIGYSPLIFALYAPETKNASLTDTIEIAFSNDSLQLNEILVRKDAIAELSLKKINTGSAGPLELCYYEGVHAEHRFLSSFHQYVLRIFNRLYNRKPGNVFLEGNLYQQVQVAYAVPRIISLITVNDGEQYNLFPTDLHGAIDEFYYLCSLRHEGKACKQVEKVGRIVISSVNAEAYKLVYSLGKNHMQDLKARNKFPFGNLVSDHFHFPLPAEVLAYRELELINTFTRGIHKLLLFKVVAQVNVVSNHATLAHIHTVYATWRHNKGLSGNYLLR